MSSKMRLLQICKSCNKEFIAKTTVTQCCSDACAKRYYKLKKRSEKIEQAMLQTEIKKKPEAYISPEELTLINAKATLTFKEAAILLNISDLTMRRWILSGKVVSRKAGKKHLIRKADLPF